jgi:hypothetical protein
MEPYDEYNARLKTPGNIDQGALPVLKPKEGARPARTGAEK